MYFLYFKLFLIEVKKATNQKICGTVVNGRTPSLDECMRNYKKMDRKVLEILALKLVEKITSIHKDDIEEDCSKYRGITSMNTLSRHYNIDSIFCRFYIIEKKK